MMADAAKNHYLFVHFKEKRMPDGEQVYFALSRDGMHWETVNNGQPVLWAYYGDKGLRDHTIVRSQTDGQFHILSTDLSLAYGMRGKYQNSWANVSRHGSRCLSHFASDDLVHWTEQELLPLGDEHFGCLWAPDVIWDREKEAYLLHFSSAHDSNAFGPMGIFGAYTKDFKTFSKPEILYREEKNSVIDSAIYEEDGQYYMFLKHEADPAAVILMQSSSLLGPWQRVEAFDAEMGKLASGQYEAPTAAKLPDGKWALFLDYYGVPGAGQGYVPFIASSLAEGVFCRADEQFSFPYGFKHGTILPITGAEYERVAQFGWPQN